MDMATPWEIDDMLDSMVLLVDTREQDTPLLRRRLDDFGKPFRRQKLDFGDYSCEITDPQGQTVDLSDRLCIERKMNLDELCQCFCSGRKRFEREFLRAKEKGAKVYLLVESATWEKVFNGVYRSRMKPDALIASILAWSSRYNMIPVFCKAETTGRMMAKIFRYEVKEMIERGEIGERGNDDQ